MSTMATQITSLTIVCSTERRSKKTSKLRVTGFCVGNSPVTSEFPAQMASNADYVSISWRHHVRVNSKECRRWSQKTARVSTTIWRRRKPFSQWRFYKICSTRPSPRPNLRGRNCPLSVMGVKVSLVCSNSTVFFSAWTYFPNTVK